MKNANGIIPANATRPKPRLTAWFFDGNIYAKTYFILKIILMIIVIVAVAVQIIASFLDWLIKKLK